MSSSSFLLPQYDPTVEESYQTTIDIDGKALQVEILDTAGQAEYTPLRETFMHTGDGFLLIYSITDDQTFEELREIREQILRVHPNQEVRLLISIQLIAIILGSNGYRWK